jgi:hypothetical protein
VIEALADRIRVVYLAFESGRYLDSGSASTPEGVTVYRASSFREQGCLIAHARHCVFFTEGDLGSHTYLPPLLGKDVIVVASATVFAQRSAPVDFWNGAVFRFGGQMIPRPAETLRSPHERHAFAEEVARIASEPRRHASAPAPPAKRILVHMHHEGYVRNCEYVLEELARKGHAIDLALSMFSKNGHDAGVLPRLAKEHPTISSERLARLPIRPWDDVTALTRQIIDYLRYFDPAYTDAPKLRTRVEKELPVHVVRALGGLALERRHRLRRSLVALLRGVERIAPRHFIAEELLRQRNPDLFVFVPLLDSDGCEHDYVKAAVELGIPTAACIASWDNLSSGGLIHIVPDRMIVWNGVQKTEAVQMHDVPEKRIAATGAHLFDHWFEMEPSCSREEFCRQRGLDPTRPFLLYACSSHFVAPNEVPYVRRWAERVRSAGQPLADVGILVRPHAAANKHWRNADLSDLGNLVVWPPLGKGPVEIEAKRDYFDSLYHCAGVVGINTSALLEGGIIGKPVFSILADDFRETQVGTVHFHYLAEGGLLILAGDLDEHVEQLAGVLFRGEQANDAARTEFIRSFIRPQGLAAPATPIAVQALEELFADGPRPPDRQGVGTEIARILLVPLALVVHSRLSRARARLTPGGTGAGLINRDRDPRARKKRKAKKTVA